MCRTCSKTNGRFIIIAFSEEDIVYRYPESLYLLAMVDYISRINGVPLCDSYSEFRKAKLRSVIYPSSIIAEVEVSADNKIKEWAMESSIPEFKRFNIVESDIRNVK